jgi:hypothetical protein
MTTISEIKDYIINFRSSFNSVFEAVNEELPYGAMQEATETLSERELVAADLLQEEDRASGEAWKAIQAWDNALADLWDAVEKLEDRTELEAA